MRAVFFRSQGPVPPGMGVRPTGRYRLVEQGLSASTIKRRLSTVSEVDHIDTGGMLGLRRKTLSGS